MAAGAKTENKNTIIIANKLYKILNLVILDLSSIFRDSSPKASAGIYANDPTITNMKIAQNAMSNSSIITPMTAIIKGIPSVAPILEFGTERYNDNPADIIIIGHTQSIVDSASSTPQYANTQKKPNWANFSIEAGEESI
tara:strand:- start:235 stop:654 length:420 start_codon:yes stop_codon:yes gene_type:complete